MAAYQQLLDASPTTSPDQPLLTYTPKHCCFTIKVSMLSRALSILLDALSLGPFLPPQPATAAYQQGLDYTDIKWHGLWASEAFWSYVTSSCAVTSPVAVGMVAAVQDTATSPQ